MSMTGTFEVAFPLSEGFNGIFPIDGVLVAFERLAPRYGDFLILIGQTSARADRAEDLAVDFQGIPFRKGGILSLVVEAISYAR